MKTPHEHAAVIKAWADGEEPQYKSKIDGEWYSTLNPMFEPDWEWRIKPEQKPDRVITAWAFSDGSIVTGSRNHNIKLTFDGETGKLKEAVVL